MSPPSLIRTSSSFACVATRRLAVILALGLAVLIAADVDVVEDALAEDSEPIEPAESSEPTSLIERLLQAEVDSVLTSSTTQPSDHVVVRVFAGVALLIGRTHNPDLMRSVQKGVSDLVIGIPDLKYLRNRIRIENVENSNRMGEFVFRTQTRSMNASLRMRGNNALNRVEGLDPSQFKFVTEPTNKGTLYLMGNSSRHDADRAVAAIRNAGSVQKIVMAIDYID